MTKRLRSGIYVVAFITSVLNLTSAQAHRIPQIEQAIDFIAADGSKMLQMDAYQSPIGLPLAEFPILFIHGGGFSSGSRSDWKNQQFCHGLSERGIRIFSMDYRLHQIGKGFHCDVGIEEKRTAIRWAAEDIGSALEYLRAAFPEGVVLCGSSAGAEAALYAAFHLQHPMIRGVISIAGAVEPLDEYTDLPLLAFHGTCDALVPFGQAVHHHCSEASPGALVLAGSGALSKCLSKCHLHAYENVGHELTSQILTDPHIPQLVINFLDQVSSTSAKFESIENLYPSENKECDLDPHAWPCQ